MNIVVLAGGLGFRRFPLPPAVDCQCSDSTATGLLVDLYAGLRMSTILPMPTKISGGYYHVPPRSRICRDQSGRQPPGTDRPRVLEVCKTADVAFLALRLHGENGKLQAVLISTPSATPVLVAGSLLAMNKLISKS